MKARPIVPLLAVFVLSGCFSSSNPDALKEHTADATAAAARASGQIVKGVFEGLTRRGPLDPNTATVRQLAALPGLTPELAAAIVAGRPYDTTKQLVDRHILTKPQYNRIKAQLTIKPKPQSKP